MFSSALFGPVSILVVVVITTLIVMAVVWYVAGQRQFQSLQGGLRVLRRVGLELHAEHPVRKRLESAPVVDLSFEEIAKLMTGQKDVEPAALALIRLRERVNWIERFAQYATHLGILGTVFALVSSDPTDLESFRAGLPLALGTTFWGLIGALILSTVAGASETVLERANHVVRNALLDALDGHAAPPRARSFAAEPASPANPVLLESPSDMGFDYDHAAAPPTTSFDEPRRDTVTHVDGEDDESELPPRGS